MGKGKPKPVSIGRVAFETQTEAREFIREILNSAPWGVPLQGDTHEFVRGLLDRHPRAAEKIGSGVVHFSVNSDGNGNRCFYIHRLDGGEPLHFSYQKSLVGKDDVRSLVVGALSRIVGYQIVPMLRRHNTPDCRQPVPIPRILHPYPHARFHATHPS